MLKITPYKKNAKKHPQKQLKLINSSLKRFGWQQPIKLGDKNIIIVGHGRWEAYNMDKKGIKVPWVVDKNGKTVSGGPEKRKLTPKEEIEYRLTDNKISEFGDWDEELIVDELKLINVENVELTGFDPNLIEADFSPDDSGLVRLDEKEKKTCPKCGYEFED